MTEVALLLLGYRHEYHCYACEPERATIAAFLLCHYCYGHHHTVVATSFVIMVETVLCVRINMPRIETQFCQKFVY